MKVAIIKPSLHFLQHRVRGTGFYISNLEKSLRKFYRDNDYIFCSPDQIPADVDLIHYPYFEPFFRTLPFLKKTKTVVTVHDLIPLIFPKEFPSGIKGKLKWEIQKRLLKNADAVITDSMSSKKDIQKFTGIKEDKINVVYLAASDIFKRIKNPKTKFNLPEKFALYVGDVTWNKNLPRLLSAVKKINVSLVMVGSALLQKDFDKDNLWNKDLITVRKMSEGDKRIITLGFVDERDLVSLYNLASVFVMPSLYEGFGLPVLEAMSAGCPVVSGRSGSLEEICKDAVCYVDPYDIDDIANGIGEVYFNKDIAKELSQKGIKRSKNFSWKKTAEKTLNVYRSIL